MALKTVFPFPIFAPITSTTTTTAPSTTEVRFSRWNNANAEKFNRRTQQNIEDDLRRLRRFQSALNITNNYTPATSSPSSPPHKSTGTPSFPSLPSIPGKKSKYSKTLINRKTPAHPAFQKAAKRSKLPRGGEAAEESGSVGGETEVKVSDRGGLTYVVPGAPFEFMYSYTEAPKGVRPVGLREPAVAPFGPGTMPRPWTGRKPLLGTKKLLPEFDSFQLPPAGKKGVKSVQKPGPYLPGSGPRYVMTREEVLGEPLTEVEVRELIEGCKKARRQLNMGRDGLTHNMLDNIHAHWKRRRVCKIKCKGVCTVDMDNVCEQLEERTGGKIIYRRGGVLFLFRGRNYNYKTRPRFPLMLWKPVSPVYPRLVKRVPEGLTLEEATEMRRRGRELIPICKLGKNGVYVRLVKHVKEAFEVCDLVRVNCEGLNPSDYRKIGAKLKDLVPCVLISFEYEHILMWRGNDWTSSLVLSETGSEDYQISERDRDEFLGSDTSDLSDPAVSDDEQESEPCSSNISKFETYDEMPTLSEVLTTESDVDVMGCEDTISLKDDVPTEANGVNSNQTNGLGRDSAFGLVNPSDNDITSAVNSLETKSRNVVDFCDMDPTSASVQSAFVPNADGISDLEGVVGSSPRSSAGDGDPQVSVENTESSPSLAASPCTEGVLFLLRQALDSGSAIILDDSSLDADVIYKKSVAFAQVAPPGPAFRQRPRKVAIQKSETLESVEGVVVEADNVVHEPVAEKKSSRKTLKNKKSSRTPKPKDFKEEFLDVVPQGSLKLDELAKLLA